MKESRGNFYKFILFHNCVKIISRNGVNISSDVLTHLNNEELIRLLALNVQNDDNFVDDLDEDSSDDDEMNGT